jgi:hypothetical protein
MSEWNVAGSYYEACNCEAVCPCRRTGGREGGRSTYGECDFVLSWWVETGTADGVDLADRAVVLVGRYGDDEPGSPWTVSLFVDERCSDDQHTALADIFSGRAGGETFTLYARAIEELKGAYPAEITLDHTAGAEGIEVEPFISVRTREIVEHDETVSCGIPGHGRPGQEIVADVMRVEHPDFSWEVHGRCGFATDFAYSS